MTETPLGILHVLRAPIGGLFRHVLDLAEGQAARGHRVGIVAASAETPNPAEQRLAALTDKLALGVTRIPMRRRLGLDDLSATRQVMRCIATSIPDVVHGHGAKGGAFVRLAAGANVVRVYTPHGGSLHYGRTPIGLFYAAIERLLMRRTELFLFESEFARSAYQAMIGTPKSLVRVIHNGISAIEMTPIEAAADAADLVFVGELRSLKGPDVLIDAIARLHREGRPLRAVFAGDGPDRAALQAQVREAGLAGHIEFLGYVPARAAFARGRILVVPSRAESMPYIVLEAAAAGVPLIATRVGGVPEIFGSDAALIPPGDPAALAQAIRTSLDDARATHAAAQRLRERVSAEFSQDIMVNGILAAYREALRFKFQRSH